MKKKAATVFCSNILHPFWCKDKTNQRKIKVWKTECNNLHYFRIEQIFQISRYYRMD